MNSTLAIAMYKPKEGKAAELNELVKKHLPTLREFGLATDRPSLLAQSADGTLIEIFEWASDEAKDAAHQHPAIAAIWEKMWPICEFPALKDLPEASRQFPNFSLLDPAQLN